VKSESLSHTATHTTASSYTLGNPLRSAGYHRWAARESVLAMSSPRTMKERVFGIYLTYSLFFLQPSEHVQLVKVSVGQFQALGQLLRDVLVPEGWVEAAFCLMRLIRGHAFAVGPFEMEVCRLLDWLEWRGLFVLMGRTYEGFSLGSRHPQWPVSGVEQESGQRLLDSLSDTPVHDTLKGLQLDLAVGIWD